MEGKLLWHTVLAAVLPVALRVIAVGALTALLVAGVLPRGVVVEVCGELLAHKPSELSFRP